MLALFMHVCARLYKIWEMLKRSQKHEPRADTSRVDSLACKPSADLFITTIRFCFTLNGFTNVRRIKWQRKDVLQQCSGEAAMSGTVARASREGLSAEPCCLGLLCSD